MNSVGAEVAPDFMFWPAKKHKFGSLGISGGLLISIP